MQSHPNFLIILKIFNTFIDLLHVRTVHGAVKELASKNGQLQFGRRLKCERIPVGAKINTLPDSTGLV
jgi:hypothetical protein